MPIKQGATPVTEAADVTGVLAPILGERLEPPSRTPALPAPTEPDDDVRTRVLTLLGAAPVGIDDLIRLSDASAATVRAILLELELAGRLERRSGKVALAYQD